MAAIDDKDRIIREADEAFVAGLERSDEQLSKGIMRIYSQFVKDGNLELSAEQLAQVEDAITKAVASTDYKLVVDAYIPNYEAIQALNKQLHEELNDIDITRIQEENEKIFNHLSVVESRLRGTPSTQIKVVDVVDGQRVTRTVPIRNASLDELIQPIANVIRRDVITGISFEAATDAMLDAIERKQLGLERWAGTIAKDALNQHDGITQNEIRKEFGYEFCTYAGTIKNTTRPFCYHLLSDFGNKIKKEDLEKLLAEHIPNGVPSESTTNKTPTGKRQEKGAGMIPGTDIDNFTVYRGGYRCRHTAIWSKK